MTASAPRKWPRRAKEVISESQEVVREMELRRLVEFDTRSWLLQRGCTFLAVGGSVGRNGGLSMP